ncbi:hypothetical protein C7401_13662 [Paraburkholderia unamae]|uniref:hypothetical protein n=1 Tax=Paraburkholderia unamae TaxID=219649 RepID=UPI000DC3E1EB|nr:hypothetical protein [Paraburkholderia unamae]RAR51702.1 hypothetical protein C7401_13662 [Paraburkholderia unamae]
MTLEDMQDKLKRLEIYVSSGAPVSEEPASANSVAETENFRPSCTVGSAPTASSLKEFPQGVREHERLDRPNRKELND